MKPRKVKAEECEIIVECLEETEQIEGNAMASGDPAVDRRTEQWIRDQLNLGNPWAWCTILVTARFRGFQGTDCLGCCSYRSEAEFRLPSGYFGDMVGNAVEELNRVIFRAAARIPKGRRTDPRDGSQGQDECFCCGGRFKATPEDHKPICRGCK